MANKIAVSKFLLDVWKMTGAWEKASNLFLHLKGALELLILNRITSSKSSNDVSNYYRPVLLKIMLIYPFENLHTYSFFVY
jgi:hypothetical protein